MTPAARPAVPARPAVRGGRASRATATTLLAPVVGLSVLCLPALAVDDAAVPPSVPGTASVAPGGSASVDAAAAAADGVSWELVGVPDASLVRAASVDGATGAVTVEVAPGYRGRVVLQRRAVDRSEGVVGAPAPVVVDVEDDDALAAGERLRLPLDAGGEASADVPLTPPADGGGYVVEAGPGLAAEVTGGGTVLHVAAEQGVAGASSVVLVPTADDGTPGEPLEVPVDVAPSLTSADADGRADAPVEVALPEVVGGSRDDLAVQVPDGGATASVAGGVLRLDPHGSSGLLALALLPSAGGVVGDPAPVTLDVAPVVAPVVVEAAAGEQVRVPLETSGADVRPELVDDAGGALAPEGLELVVTVPEDAADDLEGYLVVADADGLRSEAVPVAVTVLAAAAPAEEVPAEEVPAEEVPVEEVPVEDATGPTDRTRSRVHAAVLPASTTAGGSGSTGSGSGSGTGSGTGAVTGAGEAVAGGASGPAASLSDGSAVGDGPTDGTSATSDLTAGTITGLTAGTSTDLTAGAATTPEDSKVAPGLVVLETFSTADPSTATTPETTPGTTTTSTPVATTTTTVTALPRTGGELVLGGLLGSLVAAGGVALLVLSRRLRRTA